jgi:hypothetical protein
MSPTTAQAPSPAAEPPRKTKISGLKVLVYRVDSDGNKTLVRVKQ